MKHVIKEGKTALVESNDDKVTPPTTKFVLTQAAKLIISEPMIILGIFGSVI